MNTQYILFEKSIAVKTPGRFCSGLQIEVIRVSFQRRFFKIAKLILHFLSAIHCNQHMHHIRTDCDTQNSFQYIYATYVSVDGNKGIKFFVLVITLRLSEMRQVTVRRLCTVRAGTQKSSLVDTSKSHQLCQCSMFGQHFALIKRGSSFVLSLGNFARSCIGPF